MGLNLEEVTRDLVESILGIILSNTFEVVSQQCILVVSAIETVHLMIYLILELSVSPIWIYTPIELDLTGLMKSVC